MSTQKEESKSKDVMFDYSEEERKKLENQWEEKMEEVLNETKAMGAAENARRSE